MDERWRASYDHWKTTNWDDEFLGPRLVTCERCNGSGWVAIDSGTARYRGPGPVPDYARGVYGAKCWDCDGTGEVEI